MATQCREQQRKRKSKIATIRAYAMLVVLVMIGSVAGFFTGRVSAPEVVKTETITLTDTVEVFLYDVPLSEYLQRYIYEICVDKNVPVTLVMAMIDHESRFNAEVLSSTEDYGLMPQVIEIKGSKCETLFDEREFAYLIEEHMGHEAAEYFRGLMEELDRYREEDEDYD